MSEEATLTIRKDALWRYSTFLLLATLVVGAFFVFTADKSVTGQVAIANNGGVSAGADLMKAIKDNPDLFPSIGPENAEITVTEFMDFQCPYCGIASGLIPWGDQYKAQYSDLYGSAQKTKELAKKGKIKFVVGIMSFLGQESVYAAQAGYCANEQGKFFEMEDLIYSAQTQGENTGKFNKDELEIVANNVKGLNQAEFKDCLENDKTLKLVQQSASLASQFASGTPTFYVGNQKVQASWTAIQSAAEA